MSESLKQVPAIRFKGFEDEWVENSFYNLLDSRDGIRRGPFGSALRKDLFVKDSNYVVYEQQNAIYDQYDTRYNISQEKFEELRRFEIYPGDFIMSGAGTIGRISKVPTGIKRGVINQALIRFRINHKKTSDLYFLTFMRGNIMQRKLTEANPGSAITNLVPMDEVKKYVISFPSLDEQSRIGELFEKLDALITTSQKKTKVLQTLKKALLQKMFASEKQCVPEIRFKGFEDEWTIRTFKDFVSVQSGKDYKGLDSGNVPVYGTGGYMLSVNKALSQKNAIGIGRKGTINSPYILKAPFWTVDTLFYAVPKEGNDLYFVFNLFTKTNWKKYDESTGVPSLSKATINAVVTYITNYDEQTRIGELFTKLDYLIFNSTQKLKKLKELKKALLQKMFV